VPVFFLSDSTGISAETMGNALLIQFPDVLFERTLIPFITTVEEAERVVAILDEAMDGPVTPLVFTTAAVDTVRRELAKSRAPVIDFFNIHMSRVEEILGTQGLHEAARLHGVGDIRRYNSRMAAIEFTIEHDDGQSVRALEKADVILIAPSRCGKTPTSMYLALQHGLFVANYPLVDEDLERTDLPDTVRAHQNRCVGLTTTVERLSRVRNERRPGSRYASTDQCRWELRRAGDIYATHRIPVIDSSSRSVEEMSTLIVQTLTKNRKTKERR
jgi:regulator of PEP synthase PpsR (kinase-PPPase family)